MNRDHLRPRTYDVDDQEVAYQAEEDDDQHESESDGRCRVQSTGEVVGEVRHRLVAGDRQKYTRTFRHHFDFVLV